MSEILDKLKNELTFTTAKVMQMKMDLERKEKIEQELVKAKALKIKMTLDLEEYKKVRYTANKMQASKKKRDQENIDRSMELATQLVKKGNNEVPYFKYSDGALPDAKLVIKVVDSSGDYNELPLEMIEGTGFNEATSLTTLSAILSATDYMKFLFLDEFFSSISPLNTENISKNLNDIFDGKFQVVIVEQKDDIVEHTEHREFLIEYDEVNNVSNVTTYDVDKYGNKRKVD